MAYDDRELSRRLHEAAEAVVVPDRPLRTRSRAIPLLAGAVATAVVLLVAVALGQYLGGRNAPAAVSSPSPTPSANATESATPSPTTTPSQSSTASPVAPAPVESSFVQMQAPSWGPKNEAAIVHVAAEGGTGGRLIAVPTDGASPVVLAKVDRIREWRTSLKGEYVVAAFGVKDTPYTVRIALLDLRAGTARWISPGDPGTAAQSPVLSPDLRYVYYGVSRWTDGTAAVGRDEGIFRVRLDGSDATRVVPPSTRAPAVATPHEVTRDGLLVWGYSWEGSSVEVLELATGRAWSYGQNAVARLRPQSPRFLVWQAGGTGPARGLATWDHVSGSKTELVPADTMMGGADWSPDGRQIVAAITPKDAANIAKLTIMDERGGSRRELDIPTVQPSDPRWGEAGIYYRLNTGMPGHQRAVLRLVTPGGADRVLYEPSGAEGVFLFGIVGP